MIKIDGKRLRAGLAMGNAVTTKAVMICAGWYFGGKLDKKFGTDPWIMLVFVVLAIAFGLWLILYTAKRNQVS